MNAMQAQRATVQPASPVEGLSLDALLSAARHIRPNDIALRDPAGRESWSGLAPAAMSFVALDDQVTQLAALFGMIQVEAGSGVAIQAPMGRECVVSILAALRCGLSPFILPLHASEDDLRALIEQGQAALAVGQSQVGDQRPLIALRAAAARSYGLRFVGGFGPGIPDGVADINKILATAHGSNLQAPSRPGGRILTVDARTMRLNDSLNDNSILSASLEMARLLKISPSSRILTTLIGGDLASLASGLGASLLTGAEFLPLGLFRLSDLWAGLTDGRRVHLVLPVAIENAVLRAGLGQHEAVASLVFVHQGALDGRPLRPEGVRAGTAIFDLAAPSVDRIAARLRV
jgi:AMP-binding enzyme